ncbi:MAG: glycosyltransferase [Caldilineaceae bacterium]
MRTRHSTVEWPKRPALGRIFGGWLYPGFFDAEIAVSQRAGAALDARPAARVLGRRADVIYNAIDFARFDPQRTGRADSRKRLGLPEQTTVLGSIGMLVNKKGIDTLLHGFAQVRQRVPDAHLVLVGEGPERARLEGVSTALGIADRVHFTGAQAHVEGILPAFDLYVSASLVEGLPTVLLESVASGVPVIATDIPGNNEVIEDGVGGRLIPVNNAQALADTVLDALSSPQETQRMAAAALRSAQERFAIQSVAAQYAALFRRLLEQA